MKVILIAISLMLAASANSQRLGKAEKLLESPGVIQKKETWVARIENYTLSFVTLTEVTTNQKASGLLINFLNQRVILDPADITKFIAFAQLVFENRTQSNAEIVFNSTGKLSARFRTGERPAWNFSLYVTLPDSVNKYDLTFANFESLKRTVEDLKRMFPQEL